MTAMLGHPEQRLSQLETEHRERVARREGLLDSGRIPSELTALAEIMAVEAFYRLHRRYVISELLFSARPLFEELAYLMRLELPLVLNLLPDEIEGFLAGGELPSRKAVQSRLQFYIFTRNAGRLEVLCGEKGR